MVVCVCEGSTVSQGQGQCGRHGRKRGRESTVGETKQIMCNILLFVHINTCLQSY